jgi:hypothetical protein
MSNNIKLFHFPKATKFSYQQPRIYTCFYHGHGKVYAEKQLLYLTKNNAVIFINTIKTSQTQYYKML